MYLGRSMLQIVLYLTDEDNTDKTKTSIRT